MVLISTSLMIRRIDTRLLWFIAMNIEKEAYIHNRMLSSHYKIENLLICGKWRTLEGI